MGNSGVDLWEGIPQKCTLGFAMHETRVPKAMESIPCESRYLRDKSSIRPLCIEGHPADGIIFSPFPLPLNVHISPIFIII